MREDHPRIRGEHHRGIGHGKRPVGSSPHTRGAPAGRSCAWEPTGIIPAYAGSTTSRARMTGPRTDHPRIRGEHGLHPPHPCGTVGSSPHTRGALTRHILSVCGTRIIPAYAGSTFETNLSFPRRSDHPRIRGEHANSAGISCLMRGSSPHTRGALFEARR